MELSIPGLNQIQKDINEVKQLIIDKNVQVDDFYPKAYYAERYGWSYSAMSNYEKEGLLKAYKFKHKVYYKLSEVHAVLENSPK